MSLIGTILATGENSILTTYYKQSTREAKKQKENGKIKRRKEITKEGRQQRTHKNKEN